MSGRNLLLVDIGNSRIKWAVADTRPLISPGALDHQHPQFGEQLVAALHATDKPDQIWIADVRSGSVLEAVRRAANNLWGLPVITPVAPVSGNGLTNSYAKPADLGIDRWCAMVAAFRMAGDGCVAVDLGTATTLDAVDADGYHLGGQILPGVTMMHHALAQRSERLPRSDDAKGVFFGCSTAEAIAAGVNNATRSAIVTFYNQVAQQLGGSPRLYVTGGGSGTLTSSLEVEHQIEHHLVLQGLRYLAQDTCSMDHAVDTKI